MSTEERKSLSRRQFIRRAAVTGAAAAWAAPVIQTIAATPAYATHTRTPFLCIHSPNGDFPADTPSCMETCKAADCEPGDGTCQQDICDPNCSVINGVHQCDDRFCDPACYECTPTSVVGGTGNPVFKC